MGILDSLIISGIIRVPSTDFLKGVTDSSNEGKDKTVVSI